MTAIAIDIPRFSLPENVNESVEKVDIGDAGNATTALATTQQDGILSSTDGQAGTQVSCNDWDGPDDVDDPQNWPTWKKIFHTLVPSAIAFACTMSSSIYVPGQQSVMADFGVSKEVALLPYSFYILGMACGPPLAAPTSEALGRHAVYLYAMPLWGFFTLGSGFSQNIARLAVCRFFAGVFASPVLAIGSASISDVWSAQTRAVPMAIYITCGFLGPAISPVIGGYVAWWRGWRWTQWVILFFIVVCFIPILGMNETYKSAILRKRAKARGLPPPGQQRTPWEALTFFARSTLTRPVHMAFVEPVVGFLTAYIAIDFAILYAFFAAFPYIFSEVYGFDIHTTGLAYLGNGAGCIVGCVIIMLFAKIVYQRQLRHSKAAGNGGHVAPEARLYIGMLGSVMLPISLFWFGKTSTTIQTDVSADGFFSLDDPKRHPLDRATDRPSRLRLWQPTHLRDVNHVCDGLLWTALRRQCCSLEQLGSVRHWRCVASLHRSDV
jgi:MFS family permease